VLRLLRHLDILDFRLREALNILNLESPGWEILGLIEQSERRIAHASPVSVGSHRLLDCLGLYTTRRTYSVRFAWILLEISPF
jgi:hypothetical protein